jgi:hypothetical protein
MVTRYTFVSSTNPTLGCQGSYVMRWRKRRTNNLIREQLGEVLDDLASAEKIDKRLNNYLAVKIGFSRLGRIQLQPLPDTFAEHMARGICFHNLGHCLLDKRLETGEPIPKRRPQVISKVHADHKASWRGVDAHRV